MIKKGVRWQDWARKAIASKPGAPNKSAIIRAALADELLTEQFAALAEDSGSGVAVISEYHDIAGTGYYRIDDKQLSSELRDASIITRDVSFGSFVLHIGHRSTSFGGEPFVIIENLLKEQLHLMIAPTVEA
ncbi:hypothetical protein ACI2KE_06895 [Pseudomonas monteilii]